MITDSHCHLDRLDLKPYGGDLNAALDAARDNGVGRMLCISIDADNAPTVLKIAQQHDDIYASAGVHPCDIGETVLSVDELLRMAADKKVLALGETGLDYHYSAENKSAQQLSFANHLEAARVSRKPVIVHTRNARQDTLDLISEHSDPEVAGVLHCFTESWDMASAALDMNFYISFSGIVTFKNAEELRDVARQVPLDKMLVETDSPYLAPVPFRGKKNEPKYVVEVGKFLADLRGIEYQELVDITNRNFERLFRLSA